ncbi:unnamed protein product, partial [Pocillopora meandrina]
LRRLRAKQLCRDEQFKASLGWYQKWKKRHSISLCTKTTLAQRLPQDLEEKTTQFQRLVISAHMDKTAQFESLPSRTCLNKPCKDKIQRQNLSWMMTDFPLSLPQRENRRTSNAPDYSEDDNICTDDMPKLADDEMAWDDKFETDNKKK